jgi:hypothetical protein
VCTAPLYDFKDDGWGELADAGRTFKYDGKVFRKSK